jgi:hypothetical protein
MLLEERPNGPEIAAFLSEELTSRKIKYEA